MSSLRRPRAGFTMIELVVVLAIIVLLAGLTVSAVMQFRLMGPKLATKTNLQNMKAALDTQLKAVSDGARKEATIPPNAVSLVGFSLADPRARTAYVRLKVAQAFPLSFDEVMNPGANGLLPAWPAYVRHLSSLGVTPGAWPTGNANVIASNEVQQAICLMMILEKGPNNSHGISSTSLGSSGAKQLLLRNGATAWACVDAYDPRMESGVPVFPTVPPPPNTWMMQNQPAGPLLFSRTFSGANLAPALAILSAGADQNYGIDLSAVPASFAGTPPGNSATNDNLSAP